MIKIIYKYENIFKRYKYKEKIYYSKDIKIINKVVKDLPIFKYIIDYISKYPIQSNRIIKIDRINKKYYEINILDYEEYNKSIFKFFVENDIFYTLNNRSPNKNILTEKSFVYEIVSALSISPYAHLLYNRF